MFVQHRHADEVVDTGRYRRLGDAAQSGVHKHRLAHGQLVDESVELRAVAELALRLLERPRDAVSGQVRVASSGAYVARQHPECGRLSGAVDAKQPETLALCMCHIITVFIIITIVITIIIIITFNNIITVSILLARKTKPETHHQ